MWSACYESPARLVLMYLAFPRHDVTDVLVANTSNHADSYLAFVLRESFVMVRHGV